MFLAGANQLNWERGESSYTGANQPNLERGESSHYRANRLGANVPRGESTGYPHCGIRIIEWMICIRHDICYLFDNVVDIDII